MPISQNHRDLFRAPNTSDRLNLLQSLVDLKDLTSDLALALINIVRAELEQPQKQNASVYRRYAEVIICLYQQMPDVYQQMVHAWQERRRGTQSVGELEMSTEDTQAQKPASLQ
ncbi:MAG TPA: hypothetical protein VHP14_20225 [Anaerolineales bacterium]|nr:hypothetical protein [Anaerolineales bacterium]